MKSILCPPCRVVLPLLAVIGLPVIGLMMGCGGGHDHDHDHDHNGDGSKGGGSTPSNNPAPPSASSSNQGGGSDQKKSGLAAFLSGKRIIFAASGEGLPPALASMQRLFQFEKDGTFNGGMVANGKAMGGESDNLKYGVKDLKISILKDGKPDGGITFSSSSPKKGDKFTFEGYGRLMTGTISKMEDAAPLAKMDLGFGPPPGGEDKGKAAPPPPESDPSQPKDDGEEDLNPPPLSGESSFRQQEATGLGPNGEVAKSKHPAFIAHTWKTDRFSKGVKQTVALDKTGALTITPKKGKPIKGTWAVAGAQIKLTYPNPETGKEQAMVYKFTFGGSELIGDDGKATEKEENLYLKGVGNNKDSMTLARPIVTKEENPDESKIAEPEEIQVAAPKAEPKLLFDPKNTDHLKIEAAIRKDIGKPRDKLTKADLEKVTKLELSNIKLKDISPLAGLTELKDLYLDFNQITDISPLAKLTKLRKVWLVNNPKLTKADIVRLQKALPNCDITHNVAEVAGKTPEKKDDGKPAKVYKTLPGIDLSAATAKQKVTILERANKEKCTCGCKYTVAGCRNDDSSCKTGIKLANKIVEEVTGKKPVAQADPHIGKPLDIQFTATDGTKVDLAKMKGKVVLVDFWATWCGPCIRELPNVKKAYAKLHPKGFEIVGISLDANEAKLKSFIKDNDMPWPQFFDGLRWKNKISTKYGIRSIPAMWLVDKEGKLVDKKARSGLEGKVEKLLAAEVSAKTVDKAPSPKPITEKRNPKKAPSPKPIVGKQKPKKAPLPKPVAGKQNPKDRTPATAADDLPAKIKALKAKYREMRVKDPEKAGAQAIKDSGKLARENPNEPRPWGLYLSAANSAKNPKEKRAIIEEVAANKSPKLASLVARAKGELSKLDALGKPVDIKFTAIDGREVDLAKMKGKVVLIDFWATWCGPCVREIPNVVRSYDKLRSRGFEIIGISLERDKDPKKLLAYVKDKKMPWPQYHDGLYWNNKLSKKYGIRSIPAMWLVDKKGNLVDMNARSGLEAKVEKLLATEAETTPKS